jgi:hypothetical protein
MAGTAIEGAGCVLRPEGEYWTIVYGGRVARLRDSVGFRHLAQLLWNPYREFRAVDLMRTLAASGAGRRAAPAATDPVVDIDAAAACLRAVQDLLGTLGTAGDQSPHERAALGERLEVMARDLRHCVRKRPGPGEERARVAVAKTLRTTLGRIRQVHAELADHLDASIRRGYACSYRPDPRLPIQWER